MPKTKVKCKWKPQSFGVDHFHHTELVLNLVCTVTQSGVTLLEDRHCCHQPRRQVPKLTSSSSHSMPLPAYTAAVYALQKDVYPTNIIQYPESYYYQLLSRRNSRPAA